jgi:anaerobic selenocysteine-containing dehydrogenase
MWQRIMRNKHHPEIIVVDPRKTETAMAAINSCAIHPSEIKILPGRKAGQGRFWWTMRVNQGHEATRTAQAIINLALMTGNIGSPGTGANSITGQCNAIGSRLFSNTTNLLGGHDFRNAAHRKKIAAILGIRNAGFLPRIRGLTTKSSKASIEEQLRAMDDPRMRWGSMAMDVGAFHARA